MLALPQTPEPADKPLPAESMASEIPDWLFGELPNTDSLAQPTAAALPAFDEAADEGLPPWLIDETDTDKLALADQPAPPEPAATAVQKSLTDWLTSFDAEEAEAEVEAPEEATTHKSLTDWLTDFGLEQPADEPPVIESAALDDAELPDWLQAGEPEVRPLAVPETAVETAPSDWLDELDNKADQLTQDETSEAPLDEWSDWFLEDEPIVADSAVNPTTSAPPVSGEENPQDLAFAMTGPLPDWLDELEPAESAVASGGAMSEDVLDDLLGLMATLPDNPVAAEEAPPLPADVEPPLEADYEPTSGEDEPDWLSELAAFDPNALVGQKTAVAPAPSSTEDLIAASLLETMPDDDAISTAVEISLTADPDDDLAADQEEWGDGDIDSILVAADTANDLPDWLEQLDSSDERLQSPPVLEDAERAGEVEISTGELPDWLTQMRPDERKQFGSVLPSALEEDETDLYELGGELTGSELPEWLQEAAGQPTGATAVPQSRADLSGWMTDSDGDLGEPSTELEAILADFPIAPPPEDMLLKAEIPDWIQNLKPPAVSGAIIADAEARLETTGPLAGMPGVIRVEPVVAMPRGISAPLEFAVTPEQRQQALLLRQLVQEAQRPVNSGQPAPGSRTRTALRILVGALLLLTVGVGLFLPDLLAGQPPTTVPPMAADLNLAIQAAAGQPVLVAFDYTPALAGELNSEAQLLLNQIQANGSPILTVSQYAAGTAVAQTLLPSSAVTPLGLLPGEALGLRQLANCLSGSRLTCNTLQGRPLSAEQQTLLQEAALVVVFTGERASLVNWLEQVGAVTDTPLVAGVTQSLAPIAAPYYASGQLAGYLPGLPATIAYHDAYNPTFDLGPAETQYQAQSIVQFVAALLLLAGAIALGAMRPKPSGQDNNRPR
jgi:hypothetical protein